MEQSVGKVLGDMRTQRGVSLYDLGKDQPVMLAFLRHFGCIFCMEAMKDIAEQRSEIEGRNVKICLVHMADNAIAEGYFKDYNLHNIDHISDPDCNYYESFGLIKGNFNQLFGLQIWLRTAKLAYKDFSALKRRLIGDGLQMPGVFVIHDGQVIERYIHQKASDRPDYLKMISSFSIS